MKPLPVNEFANNLIRSVNQSAALLRLRFPSPEDFSLPAMMTLSARFVDSRCLTFYSCTDNQQRSGTFSAAIASALYKDMRTESAVSE